MTCKSIINGVQCLKIQYRTYLTERDKFEFQKVYNLAFRVNNMGSPMSREWFDYKYGEKRPFYDPRGYFFALHDGKIVGSTLCTTRLMQFNGTTFKAAGIDEVATCPGFEKRGIGSTLMQNAINYMDDEINADLSILTAAPNYHARRVYERLGYVNSRSIVLIFGFKILHVPHVFREATIASPIFTGLYPLQVLKSLSRLRLKSKKLEFQIVDAVSDEFIDCLNRCYTERVSFHPYDRKYFTWLRLNRPIDYKGLCVIARLDGQIVGGGTISKKSIVMLNPKKKTRFATIHEIFVDKNHRRQGIGLAILRKLEQIAINILRTGWILTLFFKNDLPVKNLLQAGGYFVAPIKSLYMIRPISPEFKDVFQGIKDRNLPWLVPWEQLGW